MKWKNLVINGINKDLSHLNPTVMKVEISDKTISLNISYGDHCFTDEKENGPFISYNRYWSENRYERSLELPTYLEKNFLKSFAIPYFKKHKIGESYHYMEAFDYAIFFEITKPDIENTLNIKIVSAYEIEEWGQGTMPVGKPYKIRWILSQKLEGNSILNKKKHHR